MSRASGVLTVFKKEMRDHLRDRRSLASALAVPLLYPLLIGVLFSVMASWLTTERPLRIMVRGEENAPGLIDFLTRAGAEPLPATGDYEARVRRGDEDVALVIPPDYGENFRAGKPAEIELVHDGSRNRARRQVDRARRLLAAYSGQIGALRLIARGVSPSLVTAIDIDDHDVSTKREQGATLLNIIPVLLLLAAFLGGMHAAIDTTAGERERATLEALLINPVSRASLVIGKWLSVVVLALTGAAIALVGFSFALTKIPLEDLGVKASLGPREMVGMLVAVVPLSLLTTSLQMLVSSFARSFKEAQTYCTVLVMVPSMPGMILSVMPFKPVLWMYAVPTFGQQLLMGDVMRGEGVGLLAGALSALTTTAAAALFLYAILRMLERETTLAGS